MDRNMYKKGLYKSTKAARFRY